MSDMTFDHFCKIYRSATVKKPPYLVGLTERVVITLNDDSQVILFDWGNGIKINITQWSESRGFDPLKLSEDDLEIFFFEYTVAVANHART